MADTTRHASSTLLIASEPPIAGTAPSQSAAGYHPQLASLADAGLRASMNTKPFKALMPRQFELPPLTGAAAMAAMADERRQREEEAFGLVSVNPAASAMSALRGGSAMLAGISRVSDAPLSRQKPLGQSQASKAAFSGAAASEPPRTGQAPMIVPHVQPESFPRHEQDQDVSPGEARYSHVGIVQSPREHLEERSNKAATYSSRQPDEVDANSSSRGLSLPSGRTSPGNVKPLSRKHKCPYCETEFTRHHNLKSHLLTHSKEKPFLCSTCHSRFRRLHDLKRHAKLHTGERSYACSKCGRRFARGDALARHGKGPGGCAGRRGSLGVDDEYGEGTNEGEEGMDGVMYHGRDEHEFDHDFRERLEEGRSVGVSKRRKSEPHRSTSQLEDGQQAAQHQMGHPSTYPGSAIMMSAPRASHLVASGATSPVDGPPRTMSPKSYSSVQLSMPASMYAQGQMTESPKPLTPGRDPNRLSVVEANAFRHGHSPSLSSLVSQKPYSATALFAPHTAQLPPLTSLAGRGAFSPHLPAHISIKSGASGNASSSAAAVASAGTGSRAGSTTGEARESNMWEHIQSLESRLSQMGEELQTQEAHYKARIGRLQDEVERLLREKAGGGGGGDGKQQGPVYES